jgi:hypothetical protein
MILELGLEKLDDLKPHHKKEATRLPRISHKTWCHVARVWGFEEESHDLDLPTIEAAQTLLALGWTLVPPRGWQGWRPKKGDSEPKKVPTLVPP